MTSDGAYMDTQNFWLDDEFEDSVARALISAFETKVKKNRGAGPNALKPKDLVRFRSTGPYIPGHGRLVMDGAEGAFEFDRVLDGLPRDTLVGFPGIKPKSSSDYDGYFISVGFRKISRNQAPKSWLIPSAGVLFEQMIISAEQNGVTGEKRYYVLTADNRILACDQYVQQSRPSKFGGKGILLSDYDPGMLEQTEAWGSFSMQFAADRRFCWSIRAEESRAKATIGCEKEEIKSLLYARSLPMTETGRKRPILHLVEAHKRRMRNGTDIDVAPFLRGTQQIEMNGTLFTILPPMFDRDRLSSKSQSYYECADA